MRQVFRERMALVRKAIQISTQHRNLTKLPLVRPSSLQVNQTNANQHRSGAPRYGCDSNTPWENRMEMRTLNRLCQHRPASACATKLFTSSSSLCCAPSFPSPPRTFSTWQAQNGDSASRVRQTGNVQHCVCCSVRRYSPGGDTVEKKLLHLMDMWEVEEAVALLRESVEANVIPHANVVLNLQQQLANLGEVECLLELHDFLKEHNLTSDTKFFHCLKEAYYNSGRISEGVAVLRLLYHRTRVFADVDVFFTLLTVMVIEHFPDRLDLVQDFVKDLKDAEVPVLEPEASLWKCYMMTGKWSEADNLLLSNEELRPLLPRQVARICQGVDRVQFDDFAVLSQLLNLPFIRQKLRILVAETLTAHLAKEKQWPKLLKFLKKLKTMNLPLHADKLSLALDDLKRHLTPQYDDQVLELRLWCDSLQGEKTE